MYNQYGEPGNPNNPSGNNEYRPNDNVGENDNSIKMGEHEYRLNRSQIPRSDYTDANFVHVNEAPAVPPRYYYSNTSSGRDERKKTRGGGMKAPGVIALCLACALLGGISGGFAGVMGFGVNSKETEPPEVKMSYTPAPAVNTPLVSGISSGGVLAGTEIYSLACPQTVGISTEVTTSNIFGQTSKSAVSGSGFIIQSDGYIMTNYHVIETAVKQNLEVKVILYNGETFPASIIGFEKQNDVAILKIDAADLSAAALGDSNNILVGETVYTVGNPLGELTYTMTSGMLSALDRDITIQETDGSTNTINMFQFDAAVNSGNSGGPLYNARGEVIGIVTAKYGSSGVEGLGFAIPINDAKHIANEIMEKGYVSGKAYLGITVNTVTSSIAQYYNMAEGAYILSMDEGGCAERAGLEVGDIITKLDDYEITSNSDLINAKKSYGAGDSATIVVFRGGEYLSFEIIFDEELPSSGEESGTLPQERQQDPMPPDSQQDQRNPFSEFFQFR